MFPRFRGGYGINQTLDVFQGSAVRGVVADAAGAGVDDAADVCVLDGLAGSGTVAAAALGAAVYLEVSVETGASALVLHAPKLPQYTL